MAALSKLLEVQNLDLAADRLRRQRNELPERAALVECQAQSRALATAHDGMLERRKALSADERVLGDEVSTLSAHSGEVEANLYSGKVTSPKELAGLQEELSQLKEKQGSLEDRELEILEAIEQVDGEARGNRAELEANEARSGEIEAAIQSAEGVIEGQLADLVKARAEATTELPDLVLEAYMKARGRKGAVGRGCAPLEKGSCGGCNVRLPVLEHSRIQAEPEDALVRCSHCQRVLVR